MVKTLVVVADREERSTERKPLPEPIRQVVSEHLMINLPGVPHKVDSGVFDQSMRWLSNAK